MISLKEAAGTGPEAEPSSVWSPGCSERWDGTTSMGVATDF